MAFVASAAGLQDTLNKLYAAREAIAKNQSYTVGTVTYTRMNAEVLFREISVIEGRLSHRRHGNRLDVVIG
jgi:hypothetical protein